MGEALLIFVAVLLASFLLYGREVGWQPLLAVVWPKIVVVTFVTQLSLYFKDLYDFGNRRSRIDMATALFQAMGLTLTTLALLYFIWPELIIGRWISFAALVILALFVISWRITFHLTARHYLFAERALVVGAGDLAAKLLREIRTGWDRSWDIRGVITPEKNGPGKDKFMGLPLHRGFEGICDRAEAERVTRLIIALDEKRGIMPYKELLACKVRGINVIDGESFYERISGKVLVEKINPSWLIFSDGFSRSLFTLVLKRAVDVSCSAFLLLLTWPIMALVALAIRMESPGPVIFSQERVGAYGRIVVLHKFRSMRADAEALTGPVWAGEDDPRITRVGKVIRKLRFDELPQLWNVLKGEMSFVGPRPERPYFVDQLKEKIPFYNERLAVKPGITGWAQVKYPYGDSEEDALEKLKYDLYYIKNMSLFMDLMVIFHTIKTVLLARGSR
jgi:sugar transferase (PEP-CTERM system associated)